MAVPQHLVVTFLRTAAGIDVAVRSRRVADKAATFADDTDGLREFVAWLSTEGLLGDETRLHACYADTGAPGVASAFLEFAYSMTDDVFTWTLPRLHAVMAGRTPSALAMLDDCLSGHHVAALA